MINRRTFLQRLGAVAGAPLLAACRPISDDRVMNPCLSPLPAALANHALVREAWQGIDPTRFWDVHVHLLGRGDSGPGTWMNPRMLSPLHPVQYAQYRFYTNASCVDGAENLDTAYVGRLRDLLADQPAGVRLMLLAFDHHFDDSGRRQTDTSAYHTSNDYAAGVAQRYPGQFEWIASVHPHRRDALQALDAAAAAGARAVKWLPPAMGMDPAAPRLQIYYRRLAALDLPLLVHTGEERAVHGAEAHALGNPLLLRRALEQGVRVIMAHCATMGEAIDLDRGPGGPVVPSFTLFERLMNEGEWRGLLFGDISAVTLRNRDPSVLRRIVVADDWHDRLLNGSDYPLPGVFPLYRLWQMQADGLINAEQRALLLQVRQYNPLLFDFLLKRFLRVDGHALPAGVFETRGFFERQA